jgi:hypothetical protein
LAADSPKWLRVTTANFVVYSDASEKRARAIAERLEGFHALLVSLLPGMASAARGDRLTVVAFRDGNAFKPFKPLQGGKPSRASGLFLGSSDRDLIALDASADEGSYRVVFHEYIHKIVNRTKLVGETDDAPAPLWFDEGFAGYAAGEWDRYVALEVNLAVATGSLPSLSALDGALRGTVGTAEAAYALAMSAVAELARRNPTGTLTPLLDRLRAGEDFDAAVLATTGLTADRFEESWQRATRRRYGLATWLLAGGGWLTVAAFVLASVRFRRRADRARRAALDEGWVIEPEALDGSELDPATRE